MTDQEKIEQYLASKGAKTVAPETRTLSEREIYLARRGEAQARLNERHYATGSNGVEHCRNGEGEWIY